MSGRWSFVSSQSVDRSTIYCFCFVCEPAVLFFVALVLICVSSWRGEFNSDTTTVVDKVRCDPFHLFFLSDVLVLPILRERERRTGRLPRTYS